LRTPEEKVMMAFKMLLVKVGLSEIGFVLGVTEETILSKVVANEHRRPSVCVYFAKSYHFCL
jgi:hypothetical protein